MTATKNCLAEVWRLAHLRRFAILSPYKDGADEAENLRRLHSLTASFRSWGLGFHKLTGSWLDSESRLLPVPVDESVFTSFTDQDRRSLHAIAVSILEESHQHAAIVKLESSGQVFIVFANGDLQAMGEFSARRVAAAYALAFKPTAAFFFTRAVVPGGWAAHLVAAARARQQNPE